VRRLRKPPGLFRRIASLTMLAWVLGFLWFALLLPQPADDRTTDGIVVVTGGGGRIPRALTELRAGPRKLLIAGVDREVKPGEFAAEYGGPRLLQCCITLGYDLVDTRSNGLEAARWRRGAAPAFDPPHHHRLAHAPRRVRPRRRIARRYRDRARCRALAPSLRILFLEYNKLLARIGAWRRAGNKDKRRHDVSDGTPQPRGSILDIPRSLAFYLVFYTGTVLLVIWVALMMSVSEHRFRSAIRSWGKYHRACCAICWASGAQRRHPRGGVLYAIRHESFYEAIELPATFDAVVFAKMELMRLPLWGKAGGPLWPDRGGARCRRKGPAHDADGGAPADRQRPSAGDLSRRNARAARAAAAAIGLRRPLQAAACRWCRSR
jgi:hypothetical protein